MDASCFLFSSNKRSRSESSSTVWIDKYEPKSEADIGVRNDKIKEVRKAIEQSAIYNDMIKLLILTGPTGSGKSALIKLLSRSYGFEITEWETPLRSWSANFGHMESFRRFMDKAISFNTLESVDRPNNGKIILMDDIPDLTTFKVKQEFYSIIQTCLDSSKKFLMVIIASDSYANSDDTHMQNQARIIAPDSLKIDPRVEFIEFRPIIKASMKKILKNILQCEKLCVSDRKLEEIIDVSNGDIRSAINSLQFMSCIPIMPPKKFRRTQVVDFDNHIGNLSLFHAIGKVIYAKHNEDGTFESKPDHIMNKLPIANDYFVDYIHQNSAGFYHDIDDISNAFDDLAFGDTLRYDSDWINEQASYYRCIISINGIMKYRKGAVKGAFKELAGTIFGKMAYEKRKESQKGT
ncbi:Rad17 cell cycle checkpoint protein-domain-containing protein [Mucor mucedo]|uniref:Rad17 cell cycle checkpoint protein-domain-containing protein n=1 Tax=Mucor mucedo TaxID=29922 RepID=UPI00221EF565|nr:Rad17 cell cycle checkpoint protein-domain-containing protein [Mucor mucedo]KAI7892842.1 Rad17 cell cycle checkpoint protein-domain-containing protein [Mucor mucedo]